MDDEGLNRLPSTSNSGSESEKNKSKYGCSGIDSQPTDSERKGELMETEDAVNVPVSINTDCKHENNPSCGSSGTQPSDILDEDDKLENEKVCGTGDCIQPQETHCLEEMKLDKDLADNQSTLQVNFELTGTVIVSEDQKCDNSQVISDNGCQALNLRDESPSRSSSMGIKRARISVDEHQPSVHVVYSSLTRASKQKLEGLLRQWSEWHAQHVSSSKDPSEVLECGEDTFFPALHVGLEKTSAVSFWMDNQTTTEQNMGFTPLDGNSVPLYDRGYALGLTPDGSSNVEGGQEIIGDAARCFNCGSYNHSLRECPRPRDNAAVNIARKQHKSKRNQNAASRNPARYYQNSPAGKYDGLRPGALDAETRQLLGLGELDPPPWLNRMREMGYPPGYLDVDEEDQPSGITIFGDEDIRDQEDGEILEANYPKEKRKMTVKFPGINAPIPENADEKLWSAGSSSSDISRSRPQQRSNYSTDHDSRGYNRERRTSIDYRDEGPPGDPGYSSSRYSFHPRYGGYDHENLSKPSSPRWGRSQSDRSWRSPYDEGSSYPTSHTSFHYSMTDRFLSPRDPDSSRPNNWTESPNDRDLSRTSRSRENTEDRHHRSWR